MGAQFDSHLIEDAELKMTKKEIKDKCAEIFESRAYDHGHSGYTGTFAEKTGMPVTVLKKSFQSVQEAEDYLRDTLDNDKWGPADVVPVKGIGWLVGGWCSE